MMMNKDPFAINNKVKENIHIFPKKDRKMLLRLCNKYPIEDFYVNRNDVTVAKFGNRNVLSYDEITYKIHFLTEDGTLVYTAIHKGKIYEKDSCED